MFCLNGLNEAVMSKRSEKSLLESERADIILCCNNSNA